MISSMKSLGLDQLSVEERLHLAEELWESISSDSENIPLPEAQKQDLHRRLDEYSQDSLAGTPWAEVKSRLQGRE